MVFRLHTTGTWPGPISLRRTWSRAAARPWNPWVPRAHLRVDRGGPLFLDDCFGYLRALPGVEGVLSGPLLPPAQAPWIEAGFTVHTRLEWMRCDLERAAGPEAPVEVGSTDDIPECLRIDAEAFPPFWRFDRAAISEAVSATPRRVIHVIRESPGLAGYAITGAGVSLAYLQRIAVQPAAQGRGLGHSLVRAAMGWARREGARALFLNTPTDNLTAANLYESEGFTSLGDDLAVLGRTA